MHLLIFTTEKEQTRILIDFFVPFFIICVKYYINMPVETATV